MSVAHTSAACASVWYKALQLPSSLCGTGVEPRPRTRLCRWPLSPTGVPAGGEGSAHLAAALSEQGGVGIAFGCPCPIRPLFQPNTHTGIHHAELHTCTPHIKANWLQEQGQGTLRSHINQPLPAQAMTCSSPQPVLAGLAGTTQSGLQFYCPRPRPLPAEHRRNRCC